MDLEYSALSQALNEQITKETRKNEGIYFTPISCINKNIEILKPYISKRKIYDILEPSCGSCEFILSLNKTYPKSKITGIEQNEDIFNSIKQLSTNNIQLSCDNFLEKEITHKYDFIIGNPPYFVMKKGDVEQSYFDYFEGRPNIFILFMVKSFSLLKDNGILSFVLPKNFMNCLYYDKTRKFIYNNFKIIDIIDCEAEFLETRQETIIFVIQNKKTQTNHDNNNDDNNKFTLTRHDYTIFGVPEHIQKIKELYDNSTSLCELGFKVNVGTVVWNECKNMLTDDVSKTRLIYSSDIEKGELILKNYKNNYKKNYIDKEGLSSPVLLLNRGYGKGVYKFEYSLFNPDDDIKYLIENHLICIHYKEELDREGLLEKYNEIINSLNDERTKLFVKYYFGNNAINTKELSYILPIYKQ
jgi:tRNA1(Val) A37 N6-methylase TrmN6